MKIEKTVFNVLKSVVTDNEKKKQQKLQELEDISQEPVEYCKLLLDANIIHDIYFAHVDAGARLKNYLEKKPLWGNDLLFLTLDRVITEFKNMMKYKFAEEFDYDQICGQLLRLGRFQDVKLDTRAEYAHRAEKLCKSEKYIGSNGVPLSLVDCYLLEYAIEYSCKLVTRDRGLINATKKEIRLRSGESESTEGTSPGVFNPW
jgi:predicted nucleic acid-binding protein